MNSRTLILAAALMGAGAAQAAFNNASWATQATAGSQASAVFAADGSALTLTSGDVSDPASPLWGAASAVSTSLTVSQPVSLSFQWDYVTQDENGSSSDVFGYTLNGTFTRLSALDSWDAQSGQVSLTLASGSTFGFTMQSSDSIFGAATATVSQFNMTSSVPEPSSLALAVGGVLALLVARRRVR